MEKYASSDDVTDDSDHSYESNCRAYELRKKIKALQKENNRLQAENKALEMKINAMQQPQSCGSHAGDKRHKAFQIQQRVAAQGKPK